MLRTVNGEDGSLPAYVMRKCSLGIFFISILLLARLFTHRIVLPRSHQQLSSCTVHRVNFVSSPKCSVQPHLAACWHVQLNNVRKLRIQQDLFSHSDLLKLRELTTCPKCKYPNIRCALSVEDPSDAMWLHSYNNGNELLVMVKLGCVTFVFFVAAILCDGALFSPRRTGFARVSLFVMWLLALSALLQLMLIPKEHQFALLGAGPLQTLAYIATVIVGAALLPAIVLLLQTLAVLYVNFAIFLIQVVFWTILGLLHYLASLLVYHASSLRLHLQSMYRFPNAVSTDDAYMRQIGFAHTFASMLTSNPLISNVANAVNDSSRITMQSMLPPHLYERLEDNRERSLPQTQNEAQQSSQSSSNSNERTPLLPAE